MIILQIVGDKAGKPSKSQHFWGMDLSETFQGAGGVGGLLAVSSNGNFYFPTYDNNGNITKYIDESGNIVAAYEYDDFGRLVSRSGSLADFFRIRFSTKYFDSETGLYYYGYRFYLPTLMRWLNRDPIGEEGGLNLYGFCVNSPVNMTDHFGLATVKESLVFMYDLTTGIVPGKILAYTDASAFLQVDCACDGQKSRRWVLNSVSLEIIATVHHQKNGYGANIGASFFAHKSESEHVNDIKYGVRDLIAPTINNQEMILKMNGYGSQLECVTANTEAILRLVSGMLKKTIQDSVDNRDKTGKHDWIGF